MKKKKKIVCYMGTLNSGGAEHQMVILSGLLSDHGYEVSIPTYRDGVDFYKVDPRVKREHIADGKPNIIKVLALMWHALTVKADVVISWGFFQSVFILTALLFRPDVKVICGERECTKLTPSIYEKILYAILYRRAAYIVPNSYAQRDYEVAKHPSYASKIVTIINYTDIEYFKAEKYPNNNITQIGIICRVEQQKNMWNIIEAMKLVKQKIVQPFVIHWYGKKDYTSPSQIEYIEKGYQKIRDYGLHDNFIFEGRTKDVAGVIKSCDVMCLGSFFEGFSNSLSEYISCGKPVLCSNIDENTIMVKDGVNGFTFDPYSVASIAEAFIKFFGLDLKEKQRMGIKSRERAEELFNKEKFVGEYIRLIEG